ncbi:NAD-P-binding protein [Dentipellis sp. KUC8613]|nr:NAD-P-binding protein [Dentipellis sp. KUC8613]
MSLLVLTASDVARLTASIPTPQLLTQQARVFHALSSSSAQQTIETPHRTAVTMPQHRALFMPSRIAGVGTAIKIVSVPTAAGDARGLPASTLVLDEDTGAAIALVNARTLTALRTASGSVLSATLLHPPSTSRPTHVAAFGAGAQIHAHLMLLLSSYPTLTHATIINRTLNARLSALLSSLRTTHPHVHFTAPTSAQSADVEAAVRAADFICTATSATAPLFPAEWVKAGAHVMLVGSYTPQMREVDGALLRRAGAGGVVVDSRAACLVEAGELIAAGLRGEELTEVGELVRATAGEGEGMEWAYEREEARCEAVKRAGDVTVWKSVGVGAQDVAVVCAVVGMAREKGVGTLVEGYDA